MSTGATGSSGVGRAEQVGFGVYGWFCDRCFGLAGFGGIILGERLLLHELGSEQGKRREDDGAAGAEGKVFSLVLEMNAAGRRACVDGVSCKV